MLNVSVNFFILSILFFPPLKIKLFHKFAFS
jgi:hypothetical protein